MKSAGFLMFTLLGVSMFLMPQIAKETQAQETVELGKVKWNRDLEAAKALSAKTGKPMFVQFQEVPG